MRVILAGGGTGGHIYPAITIARELIRRDPTTEILFVGGKRGLESEIIPKEGFKLITLNLQGIPRKISPQVFKSLWLAGQGVVETFRIIREFRPNLVIGTGGYVCGPMLLAASMMGVPTAIQEQNAFPGLTNRVLGRLVKRVFLAYPEAERFFNHQKIRITGNPIRNQEFQSVKRPEAEKALGLKPNGLNLLVFGGSQSARRITESLLPVLPKLLAAYPALQIMLMTGQKEYQRFVELIEELNLPGDERDRLYLTQYFYKIAEAYCVSDLILARAGAISLAEITCFGVPALLIPYPYATNNHQEFNARALEKNGAASVIIEKDLTPEILWSHLTHLIDNQQLREKMARASLEMSKPQAAGIIVSELVKLVS
jgi:UDP-N-acetylglucosamine--N-acetylmuramyl-(pentapeptide) pyrophosphoryl-undecaprenol N-acetylglucosamine transferase